MEFWFQEQAHLKLMDLSQENTDEVQREKHKKEISMKETKLKELDNTW